MLENGNLSYNFLYNSMYIFILLTQPEINNAFGFQLIFVIQNITDNFLIETSHDRIYGYYKVAIFYGRCFAGR